MPSSLSNDDGDKPSPSMIVVVFLFADVYNLTQRALTATNCHTKSLREINLSAYRDCGLLTVVAVMSESEVAGILAELEEA